MVSNKQNYICLLHLYLLGLIQMVGEAPTLDPPEVAVAFGSTGVLRSTSVTCSAECA